MNNELTVFEQNHLVAFKQLSDLKKAQDDLKAQEETIKAQLETAMNEHGIKSIKNEYITISYIEASSSDSIDLKALEKNEPELYEDLQKDYKKTTTRKAYVKFTVK